MEETGSTDLRGHSVQPWGLVCQGRSLELYGSGKRCEGPLTRGTYMEIDRDKKTGRNQETLVCVALGVEQVGGPREGD